MAEKYIERHTVLEIIDRYARTVTGESSIAVVKAVRDIVDIICPDADVVEVVHCKDCQLHGNCTTEDSFIISGLCANKSFCCVGKRKGADNG